MLMLLPMNKKTTKTTGSGCLLASTVAAVMAVLAGWFVVIALLLK